MEKYLALVLLVAPGFIANYVATILGVTSTKKGEFDSIMRYFSYSFFAITAALIIAIPFNMISLDMTWSNFITNCADIGFSVKFFFLMLLSGAIVGSLWAKLFSGLLQKKFNWINRKLGRNETFSDGSLLHKLFADGKDHFLIVQKDGRDIAVGFYYASTDPDDDRVELSVTEYPAYRQALEKARNNTAIKHPLQNILQTYMDFTNNFVIIETEYPREWLNQ